MKKLVVFNTYDEALNHIVKHGEAEYSIGSLEEGAGRINTKGNDPFDLVVFIDNSLTINIGRYIDLLGKFYEGLEYYKLVHEGTKIH